MIFRCMHDVNPAGLLVAMIAVFLTFHACALVAAEPFTADILHLDGNNVVGDAWLDASGNRNHLTFSNDGKVTQALVCTTTQGMNGVVKFTGGCAFNYCNPLNGFKSSDAFTLVAFVKAKTIGTLFQLGKCR